MTATQTIEWAPFSAKHKRYINNALKNQMNVAEGAIRSGKTIDHCIIAAAYLEICPDTIHLASGSTIGNAKLNIGVCNGFGLENLFRGRCHWGKFKDNEALFISTQTGEKIVIFAGGGKRNSYKKILGNSYGLWIATEINEHYDSDDSRESFVKVAFGRQAAAQKPLVLWDLNPCNPKHRIYTDYIDKYKTGLVGGYQYEHFTIHDNLSISDQRKNELISKYDKGSIWYRRDILGERCVAEGLIYPLFADSEKRYSIDPLDITADPDYRPKDGEKAKIKIKYINIGVDFGGNGSQHAFCATGITADFHYVIPLSSKTIKATGTDVDLIIREFKRFAEKIESVYGFVDVVYADSAEQAIINSMRAKTKYSIKNSIKNEINDRIRCEDILLTSDRMKLVDGQNEALADGLRYAVWTPNINDDIRLDDGTSCIDILDAFEYSFEPFLKHILRG
ncbi:MAG: PBSX family phage terminase large subunit [Firmicutes bacterium]|nr:PBSX family phage terminase large subunit [Bacillota bacterium]